MAEPGRPLAILRIGLGLAQVMGATVALYCLFTTGTSDLTAWAAAAVLFAFVVSRLTFARRDPDR